MLEMFNKSRAQEMKSSIDTLASEIEDAEKKLHRLKTELRERCPHPEDCTRKITSFRPDGGHRKPEIELWYCDLCHQTETKEVRV